jgi:hypothetical protein
VSVLSDADDLVLCFIDRWDSDAASWIAAFDAHFDERRIAEIVDRSDPTDFGNDLVVITCELGAALGHVMRTMQPRLFWRWDWPYWESALVDPETGALIPTFHWAIKKMSGYGWDDGLLPKIEACLRSQETRRSSRGG